MKLARSRLATGVTSLRQTLPLARARVKTKLWKNRGGSQASRAPALPALVGDGLT